MQEFTSSQLGKSVSFSTLSLPLIQTITFHSHLPNNVFILDFLFPKRVFLINLLFLLHKKLRLNNCLFQFLLLRKVTLICYWCGPVCAL